MTLPRDFIGPNAGYVYELYERYLESPDSLDPKTRAFFSYWNPYQDYTPAASAPDAPSINMQLVVGAISYAQAIRQFGHMAARLDPLGTNPVGDPELNPQQHGITLDDLRSLPPGLIDSPLAAQSASLYEVCERLREVYSSSIGYDNDHIRDPYQRAWLRDAAESRRFQYAGTREEALALLERLAQVEAFEAFLQRTFPSKYRFSIEGLDMMVPMLDEIVRLSTATSIETIAVAMAHRGRLNVLAHVMQKPYDLILADFKDFIEVQQKQYGLGYTVDDVKYHKAWKREVIGANGQRLTLTMPPNPSHLEAVNPVAVGMARAAGTDTSKRGMPTFDSRKTMQILIHGDAAFPGQGIVAETFNLSRLPGYWTGGTIHFIANNQVGFTTLPRDGRSTLYASDLAKGFKVPIVHVNADDPAACIEVARMAFAYQEEFEQDFLIDLVGYRKYGHNELDEPGFTQPLMYEVIRKHDNVRRLWTKAVAARGYASEDEGERFVSQYDAQLQKVYDELEPSHLALEMREEPEPGTARRTPTAVPLEQLIAINDSLAGTLEGFNFYSPRFEKTIRSRRTVLNDPAAKVIEWATAEELAFASILAEGIPIRLTGQDSERGTFSHRHSVLYDAKTGQPLSPLMEFPLAKAAFEVRNSPLSEYAALGFEYGYNVQAPERLVIWEAQYGDFINGAQTIVDEFVLSAREKWGQTPSLVMLLPHGHEGAGPDHSSGRLERFLQLAAKFNVRIANCTTAAQYFHLLRRQARLLKTDPLPLVVMSPKSLLRNPEVASSALELSGESRWQPVIDDPIADPEQVTRLVFVSGKFYYDLMAGNDEKKLEDVNRSRETGLTLLHRSDHPEVAVVRVEQLYPFPADELGAIMQKYNKVSQIVWAQEEPKNMGAWEFMGYRLKKLVGIRIPVNYVGRRRSPSPAEGSKSAWLFNQAVIVDAAYRHKFN
jgi:2-oxoglutarate dehydrogenase E1 component